MEITPVKPSASYAHASSEKEASCHEGKSSSFSLELVLKKREILQTEATRLEKYQQARTELMCLLRQKHEALVTQNGSMEQLLKCRKDKLALLQKRLQDASHSDSDVTIEDSASLNENLRLCGDILSHLQLYSEKLERASLENEEELQLLIQSMHVIFTSYVEMNEMKRMLAEEIRTVAIELALAKQATTAREDHLNSISVQLETDRLIMKRRDEELEDIRLELTDKRVVAENMTRMGVEDLLAQHQRLDTAHTELRVTEDLMRKSGAALPEDFEVEATVRALTDKHTKLGTVIVESKVERREALMRRKQEQDLHSILQANIGAREDQLSWMKQQYSHLTKEIEFLTEAKRVQREAFDQYRQGYIQQVADIEQQLDNIAEEGKVVSIALESETVEMARLKTGAEEHLIELKAEQARHASKSDDLGCINAQKDANSAVARGLSDSIEDTRVKIYRLAERVSSIQLASEDELMRQYHLQEQIASVDREVVALDEARRDLIGKAGARINELKRQKILNQSPIKDTTTKKTITPPHPGQTALEQWELLKPRHSRGRSKPAAEKKRYPKPAPKISRGKTKRASTSDVDPSLSQAPSEKVQVGRLEAALHSEEPKVINAPTQQKKNETPAVRPKPRATKKTKALVLSQTLRTKARKPIDWAADESFSFS